MKKNNLIETSSRTSLMNNFLHFFNLKMFRYSIFKQLKTASSYVFVLLMIIATFGSLVILFLMKNDGNSMIAKNTVVVFKYVFFLIYFPFFTMLIAFKSVQMIRDEIDDGTLLIFNSMPYTRTRMIIEKWLSVQIVCLLYSIIVLFLPTSTSYLAAKIIANNNAILNFKMLFTLVDTMLLTSFIIQLLLTTFAILLSIVLSGKATTGLVSMFGSLAFVGPVLIMVLNNFNAQSSEIYSKVNYYEKAIRESGLKQYIDDPETKKYFEFDSWGNDREKSITEVHNKSFHFYDFFEVTSNDDLEVAIAESESTVANAQANSAKNLQRFKEKGIKIDHDTMALKSIIDAPIIKEIYDELKWETSELYLTSYLKKDYIDGMSFGTNPKLEKIRKILNSDYFSVNYNTENRQHHFKIFYNSISKNIKNNNNFFLTGLTDLAETHQIGSNNNKAGFVALDDLYINNAQYYAFLDFIQKLKDIAVSSRIVDTSKHLNYNSTESNIDDLKQQLNLINKYNTVFKLNNYLNWWTQWYMMWHGDLRPQSGPSAMFLVPNATANFVISNEARTFLTKDPSSSSGWTPKKEYYIVADYASVKPIVNMTGLYATYLLLSLTLAAITIYVIIRKDFV